MNSPFYKKKFVMILAVVVVSLANSGFLFESGPLQRGLTVSGISISMLFTATCLLWLKREQQFWYGILEVVFSVVASILPIAKFYGNHNWNEMTPTEVLVRIALIYVMVRGINNLDDGLNKTFFLDAAIKSLWLKVRIAILD